MMPKHFEQWLADGEEIYNQRLNEYRQLVQQIESMEGQLAGKAAEVNQIAAMVGKPPMENARRPIAGETRVIQGEVFDPASAPSVGNIARAINGRLGR